jgi:hypothetical protein
MADFRITPRGVLTGYSGGGGTVVVPSNVSKIGWRAFYGMSDIRQVSLPATVTEIDDLAFAGCSGLIQISGPTALQFAGANAFLDTPPTIMAPPLRLALQGSILSWTPVGSAYSYTVFINGQEVATDVFGTSLDLSSRWTPGATNTIQVCAVGYYGQESLRSPVLETAFSPRVAWRSGRWNGIHQLTVESVAISADGNRIVAACLTENRTYIFDGADPVASFIIPYPGSAVAISADGQLVVLATGGDVTRVFAREETGTWALDAELQAGSTIAVSADGTTIAVGLEDRVLLYKRRNGIWVLIRELYADSIGMEEHFGCSIALSADGSVLAVGAEDALGDGVVRIYSGSQRVTLRGEEGRNERFGHSVAISADGTRVLVGAPCTGTPVGVGGAPAGYGTASIWVRSGQSWTKQATFYGLVGGSNSQFGNTLAMSADGTTAAIGDVAGFVRVFVANGNSWPQVTTYENRAGAMAISCTGDRIVFRTCDDATIRVPGSNTGPSPATMLRLAAGDVEGAARGLVRDIQTNGGVLDIQLFTRALTPGDGYALSVMLVAANLLPDSLNSLKEVLFSECVGTLGFPADTYIPVAPAYISTVIQSVPPDNRNATYYPSTLFTFFPSGTVVTPDPAFSNVIYCLAPDVDYTFGNTVVNYRRMSEVSMMVRSLPGSGAFIPSSGGAFSPSATAWRIANAYGGTGLIESAMALVAADPMTFTVADYVRIAWLTTDMTLSADADTARVGRILSQKFLPYARGVRAVVEFTNSSEDVLRTGYFVGKADGSVRFPSSLVLTRSSALTQIEPGVFDAEIQSVILNGVTYTVHDGNIVLTTDGLWTINLNGTTIMLPGAPTYSGASVTIPRTVAHIPAGYLASAGVTSVVFEVAHGEERQMIGAGAFPTGCAIRVEGALDQSYAYEGRSLMRIGGVFYSDNNGALSLAWYPSPLRITGTRLAVPLPEPPLDIVCESDVTFVITDDAQSDMFLWRSAIVNSIPLIQNTGRAHAIEYRAGTTAMRYVNFPTSSSGVSHWLASLYIYPLVKLLGGFQAAHANPANVGATSLYGAFGLDPGTVVVIPHSSTSAIDMSGEQYKFIRYRFTQSSLAEGQTFYHGNLAWTNSRTATESRIQSALVSVETGGIVYLQTGAFSLYPHMFGPWRRTLTTVLETDGFDLVAPNSSIPAFAFKDCIRLTNHALLYDRSVGASAFENCRALLSMYATGATTSGRLLGAVGQATAVTVGARAFKGCVGLTSVTIQPSTVALEIGESAFEGCSGVGTVTLRSRGDLRIGRAAFRNCSALTQITLDASGSITMDAAAFSGCSEATTLRITSAGLTVAAGVFNNLAKLGVITITGRGAITVAERAFTGCCTAAEASLTITSSSGKVLINDYAFSGCSGIATVDLDASGEVLIGDYAFNGCASRAAVPLTSRLTIDASGSVTIAKGAFTGCTHLGPVSVQTPDMVFVFGGAFSGCYTTARPYGATVVLRGSRTAIDSGAFTGCAAVTSILVTGLTTSNSFPFTTMPNLQTFDCTTANMLTLGTMAGHGALRSVITSGLDLAVASDQFTGCSQLHTVRIANTLTGMVANALSNCVALRELALHFRDDASCVMGTMTASPLTSLRVTGGSILSIPVGFCNSRGALTTVRLQSQVLQVSGTTTMINAFRACSQLASLSIETTDMVTSSAMIDIDQAMTGLVTLDISGNLNVSGSYRFWENSVLQSIRIRGTLLSNLAGIPKATIRVVDIRAAIPITIPEYQYMNAPALQVFTVNDVKEIGEGAFFGCAQLMTFEFGPRLEIIDRWAFANTGISGEVVMPDSLVEMGVGYFIGCPNLKKITYLGPVFEFVDPTRIRNNIWNEYTYLNGGVTAYDVCGAVTITKGTDDAYQVQYANLSGGVAGSTQTIAKPTLYKDLNWTYLQERTSRLESVLATLMAHFRNNTNETSAPDWIVGEIWKLKSIAQDCESIWNYNEALTKFGGWNPTTRRFATIDALARGIDSSGNTIDPSGHFFISGAAYDNYVLHVYSADRGNVSENFAAALAANSALFTTSAGAKYTSVPVPYRLAPPNAQSKIRLLLPQSGILKIDAEMEAKRNGDEIVGEFINPNVTMDDNTIFAVEGTLTRSLSAGLSTNHAAVVRWIVDNSETIFGANSVGIALNGLTSSIRNLDYKSNTTIEIRSATVICNMYSMTTMFNTTIDILCAIATIDNNAFNFWSGGSKLYMRSIYDPNVGVDVFMGSDNITIDSDKYLINTPTVHLSKISMNKLDEIPNIIQTVSGVDPANTRDMKVGTFIPENSSGFNAYSYIEFQELPSLRMFYILQEPDDWFWTRHFEDGSGLMMKYMSDVTTSGDDSQNPGLVDRMAPATFSFGGHVFTRTDNPKQPLHRDGPTTATFRAVKTANVKACDTAFDSTPAGAVQQALIDIGIDLAVTLVITILTLGTGFLLGKALSGAALFIVRTVISITLDIVAVIIIQFITVYIRTGFISFGELGFAFFFEIILIIVLHIRFPKPKPTIVVSPDPIAGGKAARWGKAKVFPKLKKPDIPTIPDVLVPIPVAVGDDIVFEVAKSAPGVRSVGQYTTRLTPVKSAVVKTKGNINQKIVTRELPSGKKQAHLVTKPDPPKPNQPTPAPKPKPSPPKPSRPDLTGKLLEAINLKQIDPNVYSELGSRVKWNIERFNEVVGNPLNRQYKLRLQNLEKAVEARIGEIGYEKFSNLLEKYKDSQPSIGRRGISRDGDSPYTFFQQLNLELLYASALLIDDCTSAASGYEIAQYAKQYDEDMGPAAADVTLGELACFNSQALLPTLGLMSALSESIYHTETYYDAYDTATSVSTPPFMFPVRRDPISPKTTFLLQEFVLNGTQHKHPLRYRIHDGRECLVSSLGNPLLLRSSYLWDDTHLGGPTNITNFEKNQLNITPIEKFSNIVLTCTDALNSEVYLANRPAVYTSSNREAQNLVYSGAENVSIIIPPEVTEIPDNAFTCASDNHEFTPFTLLNVFTHIDLTRIGARAFSRTGLKSIIYPANTTIGADAFAFTTPRISIFETSGIRRYATGSGLYRVEIPYMAGSLASDQFLINPYGSFRIYQNGTLLLYDYVAPPIFPATIYTGQRLAAIVPTSTTTMTFTAAGEQVVINMAEVGSVCFLENITSTYTYGDAVLVGRANKIQVTTPITRTTVTTSPGVTTIRNNYVGTNQFDTVAYPEGVKMIVKDYVPSTGFITLTNIASISVQGLGTTRMVREIADTTVAERAFYKAGPLAHAFIPTGCVSIGDSAFEDCSGIVETICLPDGLRTIGENAFAGTNIGGIVLPLSVTAIGKGAIPPHAKVLLLSDAEGNVAPAAESLLGMLRSTNTVIVRSVDVLFRILPMAKSAPIRLERPPPPPSRTSAIVEEGSNVAVITWESTVYSRDTPATSFNVRYWRDEEIPIVFEGVTSPFCIHNLETGAPYTVSVCGVNGAGEGEANTILVAM